MFQTIEPPRDIRLRPFLVGIGVFGFLFASGPFWALFASDQGLASLGNRLPHLFPINNSATRSAQSIRNVLEGRENGFEVLIFDCVMGHGRGPNGRTVVAVRGQLSDFGWARFGPDLKSEQVGEWALVFSSQRLMELEEIAALTSESERTAAAGR